MITWLILVMKHYVIRMLAVANRLCVHQGGHIIILPQSTGSSWLWKKVLFVMKTWNVYFIVLQR